MKLEEKIIGVLMGGLSPEREVSLASGNAVLEALERKGLNGIGIDVSNNVAFSLEKNKIDIAFIVLHGIYGEDGCIQGLLEYAKIPYTGSGVLASALAYDKVKSKEIFKFNKTEGGLNFITSLTISDLANKYDLRKEEIGHSKITSNKLFILKKSRSHEILIKYTKYLFQYFFIVFSQNEATTILYYYYNYIFWMF